MLLTSCHYVGAPLATEIISRLILLQCRLLLAGRVRMLQVSRERPRYIYGGLVAFFLGYFPLRTETYRGGKRGREKERCKMYQSIFELLFAQPTHLQSTMSSAAGEGGRGNGRGGFGRARRFKKKVFILNGN